MNARLQQILLLLLFSRCWVLVGEPLHAYAAPESEIPSRNLCPPFTTQHPTQENLCVPIDCPEVRLNCPTHPTSNGLSVCRCNCPNGWESRPGDEHGACFRRDCPRNWEGKLLRSGLDCTDLDDWFKRMRSDESNGWPDPHAGPTCYCPVCPAGYHPEKRANGRCVPDGCSSIEPVDCTNFDEWRRKYFANTPAEELPEDFPNCRCGDVRSDGQILSSDPPRIIPLGVQCRRSTEQRSLHGRVLDPSLRLFAVSTPFTLDRPGDLQLRSKNIRVGDIDGDGRSDLLIYSPNDQQLWFGHSPSGDHGTIERLGPISQSVFHHAEIIGGEPGQCGTLVDLGPNQTGVTFPDSDFYKAALNNLTTGNLNVWQLPRAARADSWTLLGSYPKPIRQNLHRLFTQEGQIFAFLDESRPELLQSCDFLNPGGCGIAAEWPPALTNPKILLGDVAGDRFTDVVLLDRNSFSGVSVTLEESSVFLPVRGLSEQIAAGDILGIGDFQGIGVDQLLLLEGNQLSLIHIESEGGNCGNIRAKVDTQSVSVDQFGRFQVHVPRDFRGQLSVESDRCQVLPSVQLITPVKGTASPPAANTTFFLVRDRDGAPLSVSSRLDQGPFHCMGFLPESRSERWGRIYENCPSGYAVIEVDDDGDNWGMSCCRLRDGVLREGADPIVEQERCPVGYIVTGIELDKNCSHCPRPYVCQAIDESQYELLNPQPGSYWGSGYGLQNGKRTFDRQDFPPELRVGIGRASWNSWDTDGCIGQPWGALLIGKQQGRGCGSILFSQLQRKSDHDEYPFRRCLESPNPFNPSSGCRSGMTAREAFRR